MTRELARKGAPVVMAARDRGKVGAARAGLLAELPGASLALVTIDLASLASVRQAAQATLERHPVLAASAPEPTTLGATTLATRSGPRVV